MRVAVVGGGVSGLAAAYELLATGGDGISVTLYEAEDSLGGQARTVAVSDGVQLDLGFMSFNQVGSWLKYHMYSFMFPILLLVPWFWPR
jgi:cyclopropane-fatty-acyl-phospholipid synthase